MKALKQFTKATIAVIIGVYFNSCSNEDTPDIPIDAPPVVIDMTVAESRAVTQSMDFGFDLFRRLCGESGGEDVFMSPLSASMAMSMLANGASGQSQAQILTALGYAGNEEGLDALNSINSRLLTTLPITDAQTKLALANSVWADNGFPLKDSFKQTMASVYKAAVENVDMSSPATITRINRWSSDNTNGLIPQILDDSESGLSVLLNALYFKGIWTDKFYESNTKSDYFMREDGSRRLVKMMNISEELPYTENSDFRITAKEFGNGAFRMYFLLPADGCTLESSMSALTVGNWKSWIARMSEREINLTLPRFTLEGYYELTDILKSMGVSNVFNSEEANLSGMTTADAYISYVKQKTYIEVTEDGAEAAAVTVIGDLGSGDGRRVEFRLNRPFVFLIAEKSTGAILFAGKVSYL